MAEIWNEIVEAGNAFPQTEPLTRGRGADLLRRAVPYGRGYGRWAHSRAAHSASQQHRARCMPVNASFAVAGGPAARGHWAPARGGPSAPSDRMAAVPRPAIQRRGCQQQAGASATESTRVRAHRHDSRRLPQQGRRLRGICTSTITRRRKRSSTSRCRTARGTRGRWFSMVPEAGFEPRTPGNGFETVVSAVPPLGLRGTSAV